MKRPVLFKRWITIMAVRDSAGRWPAKEWFESLERRDRKRAEAGMVSFDATEEAGIHQTGRIEPVKGRHRTMVELKLTRGGSTGPQLRLLGEMRGRTFYAALGLHKTTQRLPPRSIRRAEEILEAGLDDDDDEEAEEGEES